MRKRWRFGPGRLVTGLVVLVVVGGGVAAWALTRSSGPHDRVATVAYASVSQAVDSVGTVSAVNTAVVSFPESGDVASVPVAVGDSVSPGQVLATLATTSLQQQMAQADQTLADDQQKLAGDQTSQATAAADPPGAPVAAAGRSSTAAADPSATAASTRDASSQAGAVTADVAAVQHAQQQLRTDQKALDDVLGDQSLRDLQGLIAPSGPCAATLPSATTITAVTDPQGTLSVITPGPATVTATGTTVSDPVQSAGRDTYTVTGSPSTTYTVSVTPAQGSLDATTCTAAITTLVTELDPSSGSSAWALDQAVDADELALQAATAKLEAAAGTATHSGSSAVVGAVSGSSSGGSGTSGAFAHSVGAVGQPATPQQLAADQAAVDAATAQVAVAQQNLSEAAVTSPIAGTVEAVGLSAGLSAGSGSVTVVGPGAEQVTTTVPLTDVDLVKVGDAATVRVDGIATPLRGRVSSIGALSETTGSATTYPVTVLLDPTSARLYGGSGATVSIAVASVTHVLTVPSSAVHALGALDSVTVLSGGRTQTDRVVVGAVGPDRTQIVSGLKAGQQVVLANLKEPLPTATTNPLRGLVGGGGGGFGRPTGGRGTGGATRTGA